MIKVGHDRPVNLIASKLLWKAPWWAHAPAPVRMAILSVKKENTWEAWVDYTKAPPAPEHGCQAITDQRGKRVYWHWATDKEFGREFTIIGYSRKTGRRKEDKARGKPDWWIGDGWKPRGKTTRNFYTHYWWAVDTDGEIHELRWRDLKPCQK